MKRSEAEKLLKELIADYYGVRYLLKEWKERAAKSAPLLQPGDHSYAQMMVREYTDRLRILKRKIAKLKRALDK